jgi:hypothetical protein
MASGGPSAPVAGLSLAAVLRAGIIGSRPSLPRHHWRILNALLACRTPALGGHCYRCLECGRTHFVPHSCRNRHCPLCQGRAAKDWLAKQEAALLPVPYFHLVFTLPHALNPLIQQNQRALYNLLFHAASQTLLEFGQNRFQAQLGIPAVLHTWSQTLLDHYHLHCIVTGGGLSTDGSQWVSAPPHFLFAVRALSLVFRGKYCAGLEQLYTEGQLQFHGKLQPLGHPRHPPLYGRRASRPAGCLADVRRPTPTTAVVAGRTGESNARPNSGAQGVSRPQWAEGHASMDHDLRGECRRGRRPKAGGLDPRPANQAQPD